MKLSKRFKVGIFSWMILMIYFISDNLWVELITFEILMVLLIYDGKLTKKSESVQLIRGIILVIFGLYFMMLSFQKMHNDSLQRFNKNYEENNSSTKLSSISQSHISKDKFENIF